MKIIRSRRLIVVLALAVTLIVVSILGSSPAMAQSALAPGLYVTNIRIEPQKPTPNTPITFYATILNNSGPYSNFRWFVQIYTPSESNHPIGQTSADATFNIPVGTTEMQSLGTWKIGPGDPCQYFTARIVWLDNNKKANTFLKTNGSPAEFPYMICTTWPNNVSQAPSIQAAQPSVAPVAIPIPTSTSTPMTFSLDTSASMFYSFQSSNYPKSYIGYVDKLGELVRISSREDILTASFKIIPGLANSKCFSFESYDQPGNYLRNQDGRIKLHALRPGTPSFNDDVTFCQQTGLADPTLVSFESYSQRGTYLRHRDGHLYSESGNTDLFRSDATFKVVLMLTPSSFAVPASTNQSVGFNKLLLPPINVRSFSQGIKYASDVPENLRYYDPLEAYKVVWGQAPDRPLSFPPMYMEIQLGYDPRLPLPIRCNMSGWVELSGDKYFALTHDQVIGLKAILAAAKGSITVNSIQSFALLTGMSVAKAAPLYYLIFTALSLYNEVLSSSDQSECGIFLLGPFPIPQCGFGDGKCHSSNIQSNVKQDPTPVTPVALPCIQPPELFDPPTGRTFWARNTILRWRGYSLQPGETFAVFAWAENGAPQILTAGIEYNVRTGEYSVQVNDLYAWLPSKYTWAVRVRGPDGTFRSCETNTSWFTLLPPGQIDSKPGQAPPPPTNWNPPPGWCW